MEIRRQASDERPRADITRPNRDVIQRTTADFLKRTAERPEEEPKTDPAADLEKRLKNAREAAREKHDKRLHRAREQVRDEHDHRLHRAREQVRDEHDHRLHRAREQARDEHDTRLRNARAKAAGEPQVDTEARSLGSASTRPSDIVLHKGDGLDISDAARSLVEHAREHGAQRVEPADSERAARLAEVKSRMDRGELNTDELIAQTAVRILASESGA